MQARGSAVPPALRDLFCVCDHVAHFADDSGIHMRTDRKGKTPRRQYFGRRQWLHSVIKVLEGGLAMTGRIVIRAGLDPMTRKRAPESISRHPKPGGVNRD